VEKTYMRTGQKRGYTLLEMLVVASLLAMLGAAGLDFLHRNRELLDLRFAVQAFTGELARARTTAIVCGMPIEVEIQEDMRSSNLKLSGSGREFAFLTLPGELRFLARPGKRIVFHGTGTCAPSGTFILGGGRVSAKVVVSIMGRIRWEFV